MNIIQIETQYFPSITSFAYFVAYENVGIDVQRKFEKQTYRNRCRLFHINRTIDLVVPIQSNSKFKSAKEWKIEYAHQWEKDHWRAIRTAYGRAPFFEYYADEIEQLIYAKKSHLFDLNSEIMTFLNKKLKTNINFFEYNKNTENQVVLLDLRSKIHPKTDLGFQFIEYNQHMSETFAPNLSVLDLLMSEGPNSLQILKKQASILIK